MKIFKNFIIPLFLISTIAFVIYAINYQKDISYVFIKMDANIEILLNRNEKIIDAKGLNEKGKVLLLDLKLKGLKYKEALKEIVKSTSDLGVLKEFEEDNLIIVNVYTKNEELEEQMVDFTISQLKKYFEELNIYSILVSNDLTDEIKSEASKLKVLNNKMLFVQEVLELNETLKMAELIDMDYNNIQKELNKYLNDKLVDKTKLNDLKLKMKKEKENYILDYKEKLYLNSDLYYENISDEEINIIEEQLVNEKREQIKKSVTEHNSELINIFNSKLVEIKNYALISLKYEEIKEIILIPEE